MSTLFRITLVTWLVCFVTAIFMTVPAPVFFLFWISTLTLLGFGVVRLVRGMA